MKILNLSHHKEVAKEFKFIEDGKEVDVERFPIDKNVNMIVGANNSRKSRFLRNILKQNSYFIFGKDTFSYIYELKKLLNEIPEGEFIDFEVKVDSRQQHNQNYLNLIKTYKRDRHKFNRKTFSELINEYTNFSKAKLENIKNFLFLFKAATGLAHNLLNGNNEDKFNVYIKNSLLNSNTIQHFLEYKDLVINLYNLLESLSNSNASLDIITPKRTYIPTLRGVIQLTQNSSEKEKPISDKCFELTTAKNYELPDDIQIFTGLDLYQKIKSARNDERPIRKNFEQFETFLADNFFGGKIIDIVALENEPGQIKIFIEDDAERKIYDLGDGIQSLIILLYPIFNATEGEWIFIEEPELNMHPGLQSLFLNTITTNEFIKSKKLQFFITSHSNHFLNCLIEQEDLVNIFSFEQVIGGEDGYSIIRQVSNSTTHLLNLIGVKNSSVFMSNCSIWVEGISDRKILKAMLKAYCDEQGFPQFIEGYHYSFFEYAGSNLVHYLFSEDEKEETKDIKAHLLTNKIFLLADTDGKDDEVKLKRHQELENLSRPDFVYLQTGAVEIENILSASIIKKMINDFWKVDSSKMRIKEVDYENERLGDFILKKLRTKKGKLPRLNEKSGTLTTYYKNKVSDFVINSVEDSTIKWRDFETNTHAVRIIEKLYEYIKAQNKMN